jgi:hypothetical protein
MDLSLRPHSEKVLIGEESKEAGDCIVSVYKKFIPPTAVVNRMTVERCVSAWKLSEGLDLLVTIAQRRDCKALHQLHDHDKNLFCVRSFSLPPRVLRASCMNHVTMSAETWLETSQIAQPTLTSSKFSKRFVQ